MKMTQMDDPYAGAQMPPPVEGEPYPWGQPLPWPADFDHYTGPEAAVVEAVPDQGRYTSQSSEYSMPPYARAVDLSSLGAGASPPMPGAVKGSI